MNISEILQIKTLYDTFSHHVFVLKTHFVAYLSQPSYSLNLALFSSYSLLSSLTQVHLDEPCAPAVSNNILGTPAQSLSIPPLLNKNESYNYILKDLFHFSLMLKQLIWLLNKFFYLLSVHQYTVPVSRFHSTLQGGNILSCFSSNAFSFLTSNSFSCILWDSAVGLPSRL